VICFADLYWETKTIEEDIHQAENTRLPAGLIVHVAHADQGTQEILRTDVVADFAGRLAAVGAQFAYLLDPDGPEGRHWTNDGGTEDIAAWFIDTDYDEESFFVRHAYFLGANDPYKALKTTLKAEIDEEAWATLYRDTSRPFPRPGSGRIAVKVINHFGDEVMKVFSVP